MRDEKKHRADPFRYQKYTGKEMGLHGRRAMIGALFEVFWFVIKYGFFLTILGIALVMCGR